MISKQSIITLVGVSTLLLFALTFVSFSPLAPAIEAQAPSLQRQNEPRVTIEFNTDNSKEEYGTSIFAKLTFTSFQDITCDKNDGGTHSTTFDDPCYYQTEVHRRPPESGRVSQCEGIGISGPRSFSKGTGVGKVIRFSRNFTTTNCPVGLYVLKAKLKESDKTVVASASANFEIIPGQHTITPASTATPMPPPSARIASLPSAFDQGRQTPFKMIFEGIDDSDQYHYRADVTTSVNGAADKCEGTGLGGTSQFAAQLSGAVDGKLTLPGAIDARCPSGTYTLAVHIIAEGGFTYTTTQVFQVNGASPVPITTDTPTPTATATPRPTLTPTATPTDDLSGEFPDRIISVVDDVDADADANSDVDSGADTAKATTAPLTTSAADDAGDPWPGHYAGSRSVWDCQELSALVGSLAALRRTMTAGDWPQAVTQPEILNARLGPGLAYDVITTLPQGTRANIVGVDPRNEWYQLELSHLEVPVWIYQDLAAVKGSLANVRSVPAAELAQLPISGAPGSRPIGITRSEVMNVRLGPGFNYEVLTALPQATQVEVIGIDPSGAWLQVELDGTRSLGWLYRDLVQVDCPLVNVRRITERETALVPAAIIQPYALHAYSGPGLAYVSVAVLPRGTWAEIIAIGDCPPNVWYQIIVPGLDEPVWVVRDFVKVAIGSLAGVPRLSP